MRVMVEKKFCNACELEVNQVVLLSTTNKSRKMPMSTIAVHKNTILKVLSPSDSFHFTKKNAVTIQFVN